MICARKGASPVAVGPVEGEGHLEFFFLVEFACLGICMDVCRGRLLWSKRWRGKHGKGGGYLQNILAPS